MQSPLKKSGLYNKAKLENSERLLIDANNDGNLLTQGLFRLDNLTKLSAEEEAKRNEIRNRFRQKLLSNTEAAAKQEAAKQTTFAGGALQMGIERKRLLGI